MMPSQTCTLYLVRHGQTQWNHNQLIQGHIDIPLNEKGERQAQEQRENLKNIHFSKIYTSDLIRAHKTAEILNLERKLALQTTQELRERNFGSYQGKSIEEGRKKLWNLLAHYSNHPHIKESKVEVNEQVLGRITKFLREVSVVHPGESVLVVTHGGVVRLLLLHLGYVKQDELPSNAIQNLAYIKLECDGVNFIVKDISGIMLNEKKSESGEI